MKLIYTAAFIFLSNILHAQNRPVLDKMFEQKNSTAEWYQVFNQQLKQLMLDEPSTALHYMHRVFNEHPPETTSPERLELTRLMSDIYQRLNQNDSAKYCINKLQHQLGKSATSKTYVYLWIKLGEVFYDLGQIDSAENAIVVADAMVSPNTLPYIDLLVVKALLSNNKGFYAEAIKLLQEAATYYEKIGSLKKLAVAYNNIGVNYNAVRDNKLSLEYYLKAAQINKKIGSITDLAMNYNNAGVQAKNEGRLDEAIHYYEQAYELALKKNSKMLIAQNFTNRGNIYEMKGDYLNARSLFQKSYDIAVSANLQFGVLISLLNLGNISRLTNEYAASKLYLEKGVLLAKQLKTPQIEAQAYHYQALLFAATSQYQLAYELTNKYHLLEDSLVGEKAKLEIVKLKEKYDSEYKTNKINQLSKQQLTQQLFIALLLIVLLVLVFIFQSFRQKQQIAKKAFELKQQANLSVIETKDKELTAQAAQLLKIQNSIKYHLDKVEQSIKNEASLSVDIKNQLIFAIRKNNFAHLNEEFDARINETNVHFYKSLLAAYPDLSPAELKLCAYLRLNMHTKEIAEIVNRSVRTVENLRNSIRKKMDLKPNDNLVSHLISFS